MAVGGGSIPPVSAVPVSAIRESFYGEIFMFVGKHVLPAGTFYPPELGNPLKGPVIGRSMTKTHRLVSR